MKDEQPTIFDAYRDLYCAQFAFLQKAIQANAKIAGLWSSQPRAPGEEERVSVAAIKSEVMSA